MGEKKGNENLKTTISSTDDDRWKRLENVEYFNYMGSMITRDEKGTLEMKSRTAVA